MKRAGPIKLEKLPKRNLSAMAATNQKAGVIKDKKDGRGGAKNRFREDLSRAADDR